MRPTAHMFLETENLIYYYNVIRLVIINFFAQQKINIDKASYILCFMKICDALRDLVALVQFKKSEKHPWRSVNFNKVAD